MTISALPSTTAVSTTSTTAARQKLLNLHLALRLKARVAALPCLAMRASVVLALTACALMNVRTQLLQMPQTLANQVPATEFAPSSINHSAALMAISTATDANLISRFVSTLIFKSRTTESAVHPPSLPLPYLSHRALRSSTVYLARRYISVPGMAEPAFHRFSNCPLRS